MKSLTTLLNASQQLNAQQQSNIKGGCFGTRTNRTSTTHFGATCPSKTTTTPTSTTGGVVSAPTGVIF